RPKASKPKPAALACADWLGFQILLDRHSVSPGQIDGKRGANVSHALAAFQGANRLPASGAADCDTWRALGGGTGQAPLTMYTVTNEDVAGPFAPEIPNDLVAQAKLPTLD